MAAASGKPHFSICVSGHVDQGKSTLVGRLTFDLGGITEREMEKLRAEAKAEGKESFEFAFYMDRDKEARRRGITINARTERFTTPSKDFTVVDTPGHRDYICNFLSGSSTVDGMLLLCAATDEFIAATQKGTMQERNQGQTRQHARFAYLQGIKQLAVVINKMDAVKYSQEKYQEVVDAVKLMLREVGWKKDVVEQMPFIPVAAYTGENLLKPSDKMPWYKGQECTNVNKEKNHVVTLLDALDKYFCITPRPTDKPFRMPISGVYNIKGVGTVVAGNVEQGKIKVGDEIRFVSRAGKTYKVFSIERHHESAPEALPGDSVGINVKGIDKADIPATGDVMCLASDAKLKKVKEFKAMIQVMDHPGELRARATETVAPEEGKGKKDAKPSTRVRQGYTPTMAVRTAKGPVELVKIVKKMGKETGGKWVEDAIFLKENEAAECLFEPKGELTLETFKECEGLGRIAFLEGGQAVMLGQVTAVTYE